MYVLRLTFFYASHIIINFQKIEVGEFFLVLKFLFKKGNFVSYSIGGNYGPHKQTPSSLIIDHVVIVESSSCT